MIALKMLVSGVMSSLTHSFNTILGIPSGPGALYSAYLVLYLILRDFRGVW